MTLILTLCITQLSHATLFQPGDADLGDLDHHYYYTWGIDWTIPADETVTSVTLTIHHIKNWDNNPNDLYVHLLDLDPAFSGTSTG